MHGHHHAHPHASATRAFAVVTLLNLGYTLVEAGYGFATDSLALLSDALHNFGDVLGLGLAWGAAALALAVGCLAVLLWRRGARVRL